MSTPLAKIIEQDRFHWSRGGLAPIAPPSGHTISQIQCNGIQVDQTLSFSLNHAAHPKSVAAGFGPGLGTQRSAQKLSEPSLTQILNE